MKVRSIRLSDYAAVSSLLEEVLSNECYADTVQVLAKQLAWDSELILVAEDLSNQTIAGVIIGTIDEHNKGYYYRIAVAREHQRKGIGKMLIKALKRKFIERKVRKIMITVDAHNKPTLPLYESLGYSNEDFTEAKLKIANE